MPFKRKPYLTDHTKESLLHELYQTNKAKLVILGEGDHSDPSVYRSVNSFFSISNHHNNSLLEFSPDGINMFFSGRDYFVSKYGEDIFNSTREKIDAAASNRSRIYAVDINTFNTPRLLYLAIVTNIRCGILGEEGKPLSIPLSDFFSEDVQVKIANEVASSPTKSNENLLRAVKNHAPAENYKYAKKTVDFLEKWNEKNQSNAIFNVETFNEIKVGWTGKLTKRARLASDPDIVENILNAADDSVNFIGLASFGQNHVFGRGNIDELLEREGSLVDNHGNIPTICIIPTSRKIIDGRIFKLGSSKSGSDYLLPQYSTGSRLIAQDEKSFDLGFAERQVEFEQLTNPRKPQPDQLSGPQSVNPISLSPQNKSIFRKANER